MTHAKLGISIGIVDGHSMGAGTSFVPVELLMLFILQAP